MGKNTKFFYGTMNASKSAQLLMQVYNLEKQGKSFIIFKPERDTRDGGHVVSRAIKDSRPAYVVSKNEYGVMYLYAYLKRPDFLFVDEIQFFTEKQVEELAEISIDFGIPVFVYGLLLSYTGKLFEGSKRAIECGFTLHELKMQCDFCKSKSTHHLLYVDGEVFTGGDGVHVGDEEYKSVCYECYVDKNKK